MTEPPASEEQYPSPPSSQSLVGGNGNINPIKQQEQRNYRCRLHQTQTPPPVTGNNTPVSSSVKATPLSNVRSASASVSEDPTVIYHDSSDEIMSYLPPFEQRRDDSHSKQHHSSLPLDDEKGDDVSDDEEVVPETHCYSHISTNDLLRESTAIRRNRFELCNIEEEDDDETVEASPVPETEFVPLVLTQAFVDDNVNCSPLIAESTMQQQVMTAAEKCNQPPGVTETNDAALTTATSLATHFSGETCSRTEPGIILETNASDSFRTRQGQDATQERSMSTEKTSNVSREESTASAVTGVAKKSNNNDADDVSIAVPLQRKQQQQQHAMLTTDDTPKSTESLHSYNDNGTAHSPMTHNLPNTHDFDTLLASSSSSHHDGTRKDVVTEMVKNKICFPLKHLLEEEKLIADDITVTKSKNIYISQNTLQEHDGDHAISSCKKSFKINVGARGGNADNSSIRVPSSTSKKMSQGSTILIKTNNTSQLFSSLEGCWQQPSSYPLLIAYDWLTTAQLTLLSELQQTQSCFGFRRVTCHVFGTKEKQVRNTTHVITNTFVPAGDIVKLAPRTFLYLQARVLGLEILDASYLQDSYEAGEWLEASGYRVWGDVECWRQFCSGDKIWMKGIVGLERGVPQRDLKDSLKGWDVWILSEEEDSDDSTMESSARSCFSEEDEEEEEGNGGDMDDFDECVRRRMEVMSGSISEQEGGIARELTSEQMSILLQLWGATIAKNTRHWRKNTPHTNSSPFRRQLIITPDSKPLDQLEYSVAHSLPSGSNLQHYQPTANDDFLKDVILKEETGNNDTENVRKVPIIRATWLMDGIAAGVVPPMTEYCCGVVCWDSNMKDDDDDEDEEEDTEEDDRFLV